MTIAYMFWDCRIARQAWDFAIDIVNSMLPLIGKDLGEFSYDIIDILAVFRPLKWSSFNTRWEVGKVKQMIRQGILGFTGIAWHKAFKDSKREVIYDNVLAKFDTTWGGKNLLYHRLSSRIMWKNRAPNVVLVDQA